MQLFGETLLSYEKHNEIVLWNIEGASCCDAN